MNVSSLRYWKDMVLILILMTTKPVYNIASWNMLLHYVSEEYVVFWKKIFSGNCI